MNKIWAPWRSQFIYSRKKKGCIFCEARDARDDKKSFVVERSESSFSMLNIYPYNNGHVMVAPNRHKASLKVLKPGELADLMLLLNRTTQRIDKALKPDGYNIGINLGKVAGAGFPGHVHIHIVPRWLGDTNFMPVISGTKVISESLNSLYKRLRQCQKR
ncbi:MAG: HIT domain-containing protein [Candidatus Omnitrophica bacterium]|nr:HIT domain-containing protein [Candidatus Omnitrophota bacterium]